MKSLFEVSDRPDSDRHALFDRDYYENGRETGKSVYENYRWLSGLTIGMCDAIIKDLGIGQHETILDFGCAKGFMVKAFRMLGRTCYGADISAYAIDQAPADVRPFLTLIRAPRDVALIDNEPFDWVIGKDVLEHIPHGEIGDVLDQLRRMSRRALFVIPLGDGNHYYVPENGLDATHVICEDSDWWIERFERTGFEVIRRSFKMPPIKERHARWENGTGFFLLKSRPVEAHRASLPDRNGAHQPGSMPATTTPGRPALWLTR